MKKNILFSGLLALSIGIPLIYGTGGDAYMVFFTNHFVSVPPYVHILLKPLAQLGYPLSHIVLSILAILVIMLALRKFGANRYLVIGSLIFVIELWFVQLDWMPVAGILIGMAILEKRISPNFFGVAIILLMAKPWVGIGPSIYFSYVLLRSKPIRAFIIPSATVLTAIVSMFIFYGLSWIPSYIQGASAESKKLLEGAYSNGALPYGIGLVSWFLVPFGDKDRLSVLKRITAASLLSMPYLRFYHLIILIILVRNNISLAIAFALSWIEFITAPFGQRLVYLIPAEVLIVDLISDLNLLHRANLWLTGQGRPF